MSNSQTLTLGRLATATGLARASLLHYEALGLLRPLSRSAAGYRLYGPSEIERLHKIRRLRGAGLPLKAIRTLLGKAPTTQSANILEHRLIEVSAEIDRLRGQQKQLARLLASLEFRNDRSAATKSAWVAMLQRAGLTEQEMREWHQSFEQDDPREHAAFLRSLGLAAAEVARIRRWSRP
jgi:MerR family transcriptional regulator, thiopeptide resistance regulator